MTPTVVAQKVTREVIDARVARRDEGLRRGCGRRPATVCESLVTLFDVVAENPDANLAEPPKTVVEERAATGKKPLEYEPEPDDEKGYPVAPVEF